MKNYIRILTMITALMFGAVNGAWAQATLENNDIEIEVKPSESAGNISKSVSGREVTLTVTPATGYYIKASDIVAEKLVDPGRFQAPKHRTPDFADVIPGKMYNSDKTKEISSVEAGSTAQYVFTVPDDYDGAYVTVTFHLLTEDNIIRITAGTSLDDNPDMTAHYILVDDVSASVLENFNSTTPFTGTFEGEAKTDGTFPKITGLSTPLFNTLTGTVKNIMLEGVGISNHTGNTGAIACIANGAARIYNVGILSGSVGGTGNTGGLVGFLDGTARVINCYSFANIASGTNVAGIVGNNNYASKMNDVKTMVMNCMFYGEITGETIKPVYGGKHISNAGTTGINNYNYFLGSAAFNNETNFASAAAYYSTWPATEEYLTRFEYYRTILNSNRQLCTWWVNGTNGTTPTDEDVNNVGIAKWVLDPNIAPYPILKKWGKYPSVINQDKEYTYNPDTKQKVSRASAPAYQGKKLGTLSVTVNAGSGHQGSGSTSKGIDCIVLDMDTLNYDYGYAKIQLPYYNEVFGNPEAADHANRYAGNYTDKAVTGWKVTNVLGGTSGTFNKAWEDGYNFADRNCTSKDLYETSGRVFAQGGYYYVPEGVTSITIEAYWANKVIYLHNNEHSLDRVNVASGGTTAGAGTSFSPAGTLPTTFQGQSVYTTLQNAIGQLTASTSLTVYDQAIVLVGNLQVKNLSASVGRNKDNPGGNRPFTIMSIDKDLDNEPDYCFELQFRGGTDRPGIHPVRFDFLPIPELGLAIKTDSRAYAIGVMVPQGHFEITETAFMHTTQFEYDADVGKVESPLILNGGQFEQIVVRYGPKDRTSYILMGGHFRMNRFTPGYHATPKDGTVRHCAVNAIGGDFPEFYLSGIYKPDGEVRADNPHCYINGGRFGTVAGAGYEQVNGNVTFQIDHAIIDEFYGGGMNSAKPVTGNIDVTINNSIVYDKYCGGPMVGEMTKTSGVRKTVTTNATNTIFGQYFGGGNGGTSYYREQSYDSDIAWPSSWTSSTFKFDVFNPLNTASITKKYDEAKGYHDMFEYEVFNQSNGINDNIVARTFTRWAQFGTTITGNVTNNLTGCTINRNFYGGGNLGTVDGNVTSTLTNTEVKGNAFGAGFSASIPQFRRHDKNKVHVPQKNKSGQIVEQGYLEYYQDGGKDVYYRWTNNNNNGTATTDAPTYYSEADKEWKCYTPVSLEGLGAVTGNVTLTIDGNTVADENGKVMKVEHSVYGGGEESNVAGDTRVNISGGTIAQNVYGGGKGVADEFACTKAMIGIDGAGANNTNPEATKDKGTKVNISDGTVNGNVYGGGEVGRVEWNTQVTIGEENGTGEPVVEGYVFGAGKGLKTHGYAALVRGNPTVTIQGNAKVKKSVYGGGEIASVARYKVATTAEEAAEHGVGIDMPYALANNYSGNCKVIVGGNAVIGPDSPMKMYHPEITDGSDKPDDAGHVFGAGKGVLPEVYTYEDNEHRPKRMLLYNAESLPTYWEYADEAEKNIWEYFEDEEAYFAFIKTLALSSKTEVTIKENAFVKGSVYGGSENGLVQFDTDVKIQGGQIGCGKDTTEPYGDEVWANDYTPSGDLECASWDYGKDTNGDGKKDQYAPYDPYAQYLNPADNKYYYDEGFTKDADGGANIATDGHTYYGNVFGGGSGSVPYFDTQQGVSRYVSSAGIVKGNTKVTISGGHILTNVYGGCEATNVLGSATITMTDGTVGVPRTLKQIVAHPVTCYIFGAGKGDQRIFFNKETNVDRTFVNIEGGRVYGSIFGGGEDGHVFQNVIVNIGKDGEAGPMIGTSGTSYVDGNVFGGGRGFGGEALTAGNIGGSIELNIKSGKILGSVYGGGRLGSVGYGLYLVDEEITEDEQTIKPYGILRPNDKYDGSYPNPSTQDASAYYDKGRGYITINISGGTIGNDYEYIYNPTDEQKAAIPNTTFDYQNHLQYTKGGNVFTGGMGRLYALDNTTLLPLWPKLGKCKSTTLNMTGGTVKSSIYGGGEIGAVAENATVNVNGGTVGTKVVDPDDNTKYYYFGSVFGGGKGSVDNITYPSTTPEADKIPISEAGTTGGDVEVHLNKTVASDNSKKGAVVSQVFGCNDMNGSPKGNVTVHVYATQNADKDNISTKYDRKTDNYDVEAVYGGGNLAAYEPEGGKTTTKSTKVIIDGCGLTSIQTVYGGGNAASTPATNVEVNGTYEIGELFGGGNGKDKLPDGRPNPGANVGYKNYTVYQKDGDNWIAKDSLDYDTKDERTAEGSAIVYGTGQASINVYGGTIHRVFGGSNTKGNVRQAAVTLLDENSVCEFCVDEAYGGGKSAPMDAEAKLLMACIPGLQAAYGGAEAAAIKGNVTLNITNGTFDRVFGGNNLSGTIDGSITVNIQEVGCRPIIIGELYGGGNQAAYSVYGYDADGKAQESGTQHYDDPQVNVMSFTSIGKVFGGGFGDGATMVGNPTVSVNEVYGKYYNDDKSIVPENAETPNHYPIPSHEKGKMGAISEVFGGGNAAKVMGNTTVNVATLPEVYIVKQVTAGAALPTDCYIRNDDGTYSEASGNASANVTYYEKKEVLGVDIRGNVYGGGNNAEVTGNTNVNIGKKEEGE